MSKVKKKRLRLDEEDIQVLMTSRGIDENPFKKYDGDNYRPRISATEVAEILKARALREITESVTSQDEKGYSQKEKEWSSFEDYCKAEGIDVDKVKSAKFVNHQGQQKFNIVLDYGVKELKKSYLDYRDEIVEDMENHAPKYKKPTLSKKPKEGRLLVLGLADLHLNQLSSPTETMEEYSTEIAIDKVVSGVLGLLEESAGFNISTVVIPLGGDVLNTDTPKNTTTSGTSQDTDKMWYDAFVLARKMYVTIIDAILDRGYNIVVQHIVANHDYMTGFMLSDTIKSWYRHTDIEFNVDMVHRKYYTFGENLIGVTHGDSAKKDKLALLMANESKDWSDTKYRYIYTQHVHHKTVAVDEIGVTIQSLRTPTVASGWASRNGYQHAQSSLTGFIHDKEKGQIAQLNHNY